MNKLIAILLLTLALPALAALEVSGVKFDDKTKVGAGETVINGAGVRGVLLRDTSGETFADALPSGIRKNHSEQEVGPPNARIEALPVQADLKESLLGKAS